jgi:hypothetical protein
LCPATAIFYPSNEKDNESYLLLML